MNNPKLNPIAHDSIDPKDETASEDYESQDDQRNEEREEQHKAKYLGENQ
jgi:hypothetical protein